MILAKIISGGQTGADRAALEVARELGLETGGMAAKRWQTEAGPDPSLKDFGLIECQVEGYPTRTRYNVQHSDGTVWFGTNDSAGNICTMNAVERYSKLSLSNPPARVLRRWLEANEIGVLNVAGNRLSRNPAVVEMVKRTLREALQESFWL